MINSDWEPISCQRENCPNSGNVRAVKVCPCHAKISSNHFIYMTITCTSISLLVTHWHFLSVPQMCLDASLAIECADSPPPLYICIDCVDQLRRKHAQCLCDILQPMENVSLTCENKVKNRYL